MYDGVTRHDHSYHVGLIPALQVNLGIFFVPQAGTGFYRRTKCDADLFETKQWLAVKAV